MNVYIVEHRTVLNTKDGVLVGVDCTVMYVASTLELAQQYCYDHLTEVGSKTDLEWSWFLITEDQVDGGHTRIVGIFGPQGKLEQQPIYGY